MALPADAAPLLSVALILLGMLFWGAWRGYRELRKLARPSHESLVQRQQERQQLLRAVADSDDRHAQGLLPPPAYFSERQRLKQRLVELTML